MGFNDPLIRRLNFMLAGAVIASFVFGWLMIYLYNLPQLFVDRAVGFIFLSMATVSAMIGLAVVEWDKKRSYFRGLIERLAAASVAGLVFYIEFLVAMAVFGLGHTAIVNSVSLDGLLFYGKLMFFPTFVACGLIGCARLISAASRR